VVTLFCINKVLFLLLLITGTAAAAALPAQLLPLDRPAANTFLASLGAESCCQQQQLKKGSQFSKPSELNEGIRLC
jgi:hypothetical protein